MHINTLPLLLRHWLETHRTEALLGGAALLMLGMLFAMGSVAHGQVQRAQERDATRAVQHQERLECIAASRGQPMQACATQAGMARVRALSSPLG